MTGADQESWPDGPLAYLPGGWLVPWDGGAVPEGALRVRTSAGMWRYPDGKGGTLTAGEHRLILKPVKVKIQK